LARFFRIGAQSAAQQELLNRLARGAGAKDSRPVVGILYEDLVAWLQRQRQASA
jgi:hypothetical protein